MAAARSQAGPSITVKVLFFAAAREMAGTGGADVELSGNALTTAELRTRIAELYPGTANVVPSITLALNQEVRRSTSATTWRRFVMLPALPSPDIATLTNHTP